MKHYYSNNQTNILERRSSSKFEILSILKYITFIISFVLIFLPLLSNKDLAEYHLYLLGFLLIIDIIQEKKISLYVVWIAGFIYIILSEMIKITDNSNYNLAVRYLLTANNTVLLGYSVAKNKKMFSYQKTNFSTSSKFFPFLIFLLTIFYLFNSFDTVARSYFYGRQLVSTMGSGSLLGALTSSLSLTIPSLIAYYVVHMKKQSKMIASLFAAPIFLFLFLLSTRFALLFSVLPFLLISGFINMNKLSVTSIILILLAIITLSFFSQYIQKTRNESIQDRRELFETKSNEGMSFAEIIASKCSPEGCVEMTYLAERYFDSHNHTYGVSIGFITYFWIPRSVWPDKPTQVDHWLPRYFNPHMTDTASTASGFTGELRADFGYFSLFFLFILGVFLKRCNYYLVYYNYGRTPCYESMYAAQLIPTTFFAIRGLNLAITTFLCSVLLLWLISKFKQNACNSK